MQHQRLSSSRPTRAAPPPPVPEPHPTAGIAAAAGKAALALAAVAALREGWQRGRARELRGDVALITGAGSGIGRELSLALARAGCKLVLWGRRAEPLQRVADEVRALAAADDTIDADVRIDAVDVSVQAEVAEAGAQVLESLGRVDLLINNAGVHEGPGTLERTPEEIEAVLAINTHAHFWTLQAFLPAMLERDYGHVVTVGSAAGMIGVAGMLDYCASKFAVRGMNVRPKLTPPFPIHRHPTPRHGCHHPLGASVASA